MLSMLHPVNIDLPTGDLYQTKREMDFGKSSLANISVKQQRREYLLKKEAFGTTTNDIDSSEEKSEKSDDINLKKPPVETSDTDDDEKKLSLIRADDIKPYDILCGRDKATFNNVGNRRFRVLISLNIPRYNRARTKAEKASVIKDVCNIFQNEVGVRFLKKHQSQKEYYFQLSATEARKKVGHALRDMSVARQELDEKRRKIRMNSLESRGVDSDYDPLEPLLVEPLPYDEPNASDSHRRPQNQQDQQYDQHQIRPPHTPAHWIDQQYTTSAIPDVPQQLQQERQQQQQQNDLQQALLRLQQQQQKLQQEREQLVQQQQFQQELLEQQIRNRRLRQQQRQQQGGEVNQFNHIFDALSRKRGL